MRTTTVLNGYLDWPHMGLVFRVDCHVTDLREKNLRDEVEFGITDIVPDEADAACFNALVRGHLGH
ncbi:MAG: hypothetical protein M1318_03320 [Firmicutes bacterium]|nr:hypothetical protein [Bacillota bacterium]